VLFAGHRRWHISSLVYSAIKMAPWIENRINLARKLYNGECGGGYSDATIILVSVVSGIASRTWPGRSKDRKRFNEVLVRFCPDGLHLTRISIPLLIQDLNNGNASLATLLSEAFDHYCPSRVITGNDIDKGEVEILRVVPNLSIRKIRDYSYANLLYQEVRSGLVHEYRPTQKASIYPMTTESKDISYVNTLERHSGMTYRSICFEYDWIEKVVTSLQDSVDLLWKNAPRPDPSFWWVEG